MLPPFDLTQYYNAATGELTSGKRVERRLSDLKGCFADTAAFEARLAAENPLLYAVAAVEPGHGDGDLHYGMGVLYPGKIGNEYFMTKGHLHAWRPAAEIYIGLRGQGMMLLEDEATGDSRMEPLVSNSMIYVPGHTAHRTMNTGSEPLVYIGVYPAKAGHDYGAIAEKNFRHVVVEQAGKPALLPRMNRSESL